MSDLAGDVVRPGQRGGRTLSLETAFLERAETRSREVEKVYAVVGPDSSAAFVERLKQICPVVPDDAAKGVCLLIDGEPSEWTRVQGEAASLMREG